MNEKQSMLSVIGSQTMQIAVLQSQLASVQAELDSLKAANKPVKTKPLSVVPEQK